MIFMSQNDNVAQYNLKERCMAQYPDYVYKTLARAREEGQWQAAQADAAALCFDVLASFPECEEASDLVYELFCDEWTIYDMRVAIQQHIDEWDDRPSEHRRRLALSFRFMCRWDMKYDIRKLEDESAPADVKKILEDGKMELLGAYCLGDEECTDYAWSIFADALNKTKDPQATLFWIGWQYADLGFFADSAEALGELCSRFDDSNARRLLAEVIWWRDNAHRIPWIPPEGDGSRYDRMIKMIAPEAPTTAEIIQRERNENQKARIAPYRPSIDKKLANLFQVSNVYKETPVKAIIDWSFLDKDNDEPGELPDWAKRQINRLKKFEDDEDTKEIIEDMINRYKWARNIPPPTIPKKYDPNEQPFNPGEVFGDMELDDDLDDEE